MALQMLYQSEMGGADLGQIFRSFDTVPYLPAVGSNRGPDEARSRTAKVSFAHARELVEGTLGHRPELDELIASQAENWRLERMPAVDRNILRLAVFEMLYQTDVPKKVVLNEAIELAKRFGSDQSPRFVNGLLDGLLKGHSFPGRLA